MTSKPIRELAREVVELAAAKGVMIAVVESCTGGMVCAALTDVPGSSAVLDRGFITYSNAAKQALVDVSADTLARYGAVSPQTAEGMAAGGLARSAADLAVSITGIAGPGGGSAEKPVGLVWFGLARTGHGTVATERRFGDAGRSRVRELSVEMALTLLKSALADT